MMKRIIRTEVIHILREDVNTLPICFPGIELTNVNKLPDIFSTSANRLHTIHIYIAHLTFLTFKLLKQVGSFTAMRYSNISKKHTLKNKTNVVKLEVLTVALIMSSIFWDFHSLSRCLCYSYSSTTEAIGSSETAVYF